LLIAQPDTLLRAVELVKHIVRSGAVDLVVVDSLEELDAGDRAEVIKASEELSQLVASTGYTNTTVLFLTRKRLNQPSGPVSNTLRYLSAIRCEVVAIGRHARVRVLKNKHATPFTEATVELEASTSQDFVATHGT
jgi:recombination protein RecA